MENYIGIKEKQTNMNNQEISRRKIIDKAYVGKVCFFVGYIIYLVYYIFCKISNFNLLIDYKTQRIIQLIWMGLLFTKIFIFDKHTLKQVLIIFIAFTLLICSYYKSRDIRFIEITLLILSSKNISIKKTINITLITLLSSISIVIVSAKIGLIKEYVFYNDIGARYSLGFVYVSQLPFLLREICFIILINVQKNKKLVVSILSLIVIYTVYQITLVRNIFYTSIILIVLILLYEYKPIVFNNNLVKKIIKYTFIIGFILSIAVTINYNSSNSFYRRLNERLSNRPEIEHRMYNKYGNTLLGNTIYMYGVSAISNSKKLTFEDYSYIDNLFIQILLKDGLIILWTCLILYTKLLDKSFKQKEYIELGIWFFVIAISSVIDDEAIVVVYNFPIIFLLQILEKSRIKKDENKYV